MAMHHWRDVMVFHAVGFSTEVILQEMFRIVADVQIESYNIHGKSSRVLCVQEYLKMSKDFPDGPVASITLPMQGA